MARSFGKKNVVSKNIFDYNKTDILILTFPSEQFNLTGF